MTNKINELIEPALAAMGLQLLGFEYLSQGRHSLLRVYIDAEDGITVKDCERASKQISAILDVEDPISNRYSLEVSSPGSDRPLFTLAQYEKFIGQKIKLRLHKAQSNQRNFMGVLQAVTGDAIELVTDDKTMTLAFADIEKANIVPEY